MLNTPFSPWPSFTEEESQAIQRVLLSNKVNYWTGQEGRLFEKEFATFTECSHAIAVANGTLALDLALKGIGIASGDEVIVTSRTFIASVSSVVTAGGVPVFADIDSDSQNITCASIEAVITPNTRAIICVHLAGWPCDMDPIMDVAAKHNLKVIEDCAQAHGAKYKGRSVGSIGDIGCWSFCQDKIMTTGGEGGMVTTDNRELWLSMWAFKDHGKSWQAVYEKQHEPGFRWLHESFGTNWRLTEMQSAIGRIQLKRMPAWLESRTKNAHAILDSARQCSALRVPQIAEGSVHAWYKCYLFLRPELLKENWNRDRIIENIVAQGVPCFSGSCSEVYLERAFDNTNWRPVSRLPVAKKLGETSLMFLVHPTLLKAEVDKTCHVLRQVMAEATT
ncbi:DegT/DnrJ/EryC1/StrS family aminotransferase [Neptunomonas sp.]|uniref:DegT/DnrJ/EryC1/StrS family aminotransferase n=1 Tax=Neptunomonas sp. TaxID=1971898 RepID=UPI003565A871